MSVEAVPSFHFTGSQQMYQFLENVNFKPEKMANSGQKRHYLLDACFLPRRLGDPGSVESRVQAWKCEELARDSDSHVDSTCSTAADGKQVDTPDSPILAFVSGNVEWKYLPRIGCLLYVIRFAPHFPVLSTKALSGVGDRKSSEIWTKLRHQESVRLHFSVPLPWHCSAAPCG